MMNYSKQIFRVFKSINLLLILVSVFCIACQKSNRTESPFIKHILTEDFVSEGVTVADVNKDGAIDIMTGSVWFKAPEWSRHEIDETRSFDPDTEYSDSFLNFSLDVNLDSWMDIIIIDFPGTTAVWYENPQNEKGFWKKHLIFETVGNESPAFADVDGDGRNDLIFADITVGKMVWFQAPTDQNNLEWSRFEISESNALGTNTFSHGLGFGDLNGDGRGDVIIKDGWWEGPLNPKNSNWIFHKTKVSDNCSQMYVMDVNGDGKNDVISASAHLSGVWWQEQTLSDNGEIAFETHVISYAFAESHSLAIADLNGDGYGDLITGKRNLRRNTWRNNPGTDGPPLLYWYEYSPNEPYWIPHQIDDQSGSGLNLVAEDINNDNKPDIIVSNFKGVFFFENNIESEGY